MLEPRLTSWRATASPMPIPAQRQRSHATPYSTQKEFPSEALAPRVRSHHLRTRAITLFSFQPPVRRSMEVPGYRRATPGRSRLMTPALWLERRRQVQLARSHKPPRRILSILILSVAHLLLTRRIHSLSALPRRYRFKRSPFWTELTE